VQEEQLAWQDLRSLFVTANRLFDAEKKKWGEPKLAPFAMALLRR
jgi:hypothetical protein